MAHTYTVEFFLEDDGSSPVARWITEQLSAPERRAVAAALSELVAEMGQDICVTDFGKNIGGGLIELRLRQPEEQVLKRIGKKAAEPHPETKRLRSCSASSFTPMAKSGSSSSMVTPSRTIPPSGISRLRLR